MITINSQKDKIAIVVVGYNKLHGLSRLLNSLNEAVYDEQDIPLIISIDASGNKDVYDLANKFEWKFGKKLVNIESDRLGLKNHIFQCARLTKYFKGVIILEDDLYVSPFYYHYAQSALNYYENDDKVSGIALYNEEMNGYVGLPFQPLHNEFDVYAWQTVCSWGEIWNERMWNDFELWLEKWDCNFSTIDIPEVIKSWDRAWSKYFYAYMVNKDKYFIYPYEALSTNFNDAGGEHGGGNSSIVQVSLLLGKKDYHFGSIDSLIHYDVYYNNKDLPKWLGVSSDDLTVDFYGLNNKYRRYVLSTKKYPYTILESFDLSMRPWELNVKYRINGNELFLYDRLSNDIFCPPKKSLGVPMGAFFLRSFNTRLIIDYILEKLSSRIKTYFNGK